ncbi:MAG: NADP-dependent malic enzyme, partial [Muribaculaceae bacterium]|nr:NADP-dependent malic enzyme [Muribaculaceae bacterium]
EMKLAAVKAIAQLAKKPVPSVVNTAYGMTNLHFGRDYILPKPLDPRLLLTVAPAVARGAMESGVARRPITDWNEYEVKLKALMGNDSKTMRQITEVAKQTPKRVVFTEGNTDSMLRAAVSAYKAGICYPILLGNEEMIEKRAKRLGVSLEGIEIVNLRHDRESDRRKRYASKLAERAARRGITYPEAKERMFDRYHFGMMMVNEREADAVIAGTYSDSQAPVNIALDVVGIKPGFKHFATMHIMDTKQGTFFMSDTMANQSTDEETLFDIARLTRLGVEYFACDPVMAMVSYSNFGSSNTAESRMVHNVVARLQEMYPGLAIDGEMQLNYVFNKELRDKNYPFTRLKGRDVNTIIFPNLSAATTAYRMLLQNGGCEAIGPIQIGLNKPVHFINVDSPVRDIINLTTIAVLDAVVAEKIENARTLAAANHIDSDKY